MKLYAVFFLVSVFDGILKQHWKLILVYLSGKKRKEALTPFLKAERMQKGNLDENVVSASVNEEQSSKLLFQKYCSRRAAECAHKNRHVVAPQDQRDLLYYFGFSLERELRCKESEQMPQAMKQSGRIDSTRTPHSLRVARKDESLVPSLSAGRSAASPLPPIQSPPNASISSNIFTRQRPPEVDGILEALVDPQGESVAFREAHAPFFAEVDAHALSVSFPPTMNGKPTTAFHMASVLCEPFRQVRWRMSSEQCAVRRVRAIYRWLCERMTLLPWSSAPSAEGQSSAQPHPSDSGPVISFVLNDPSKGEPRARAMKSSRVLRVGRRGVGSEAVMGAGEGGEAAVTPSDVVLANGQGDALAMAHLFAEMVNAVSDDDVWLQCRVVRGTLKGVLDATAKPRDFGPSAWNVVEIVRDGSRRKIRLLVDLAFSIAYFSPFGGAPLPPAEPTSTKAGLKSTVAPMNGGSLSTPMDSPMDLSANFSFHAPIQEETVNYGKCFHDFYFFGEPRQFLATHYPDEAEMQLLQRPISKKTWESYPRLTHAFFQYELALDSHRHRSFIALKCSPLAISLLLQSPAHTELAVRLYKGPPSQFATCSFADAAPLDASFVWAHREECSGRCGFTLMVPEAGVYTVTIGARRLMWGNHYADGNERASKVPVATALFAHGVDSTVPPQRVSSNTPRTPGRGKNKEKVVEKVSEEAATRAQAAPFDLVLVYTLKVAFVACNVPIVPRQHLSPSVVKLLSPLGNTISYGVHRFAVVGCLPHVQAIAIVQRKSAVVRMELTASRGGLESFGGGTPAEKKRSMRRDRSAPSASPSHHDAFREIRVDRIVMDFLSLEVEHAVFRGAVDIRKEMSKVEVWALIVAVTSRAEATRAAAEERLSKSVVTKVSSPRVVSAVGGRVSRAATESTVGSSSFSAAPPSIPSVLVVEQDTLPSDADVTPAWVAQQLRTLPSDSGNGRGDGLDGCFVRVVSDMQVARQVPRKELLTLQSGAFAAVYRASEMHEEEDHRFVLRLLSRSTDDGRELNAKGKALVEAPLLSVGTYFEQRRMARTLLSPG